MLTEIGANIAGDLHGARDHAARRLRIVEPVLPRRFRHPRTGERWVAVQIAPERKELPAEDRRWAEDRWAEHVRQWKREAL